MSKASIAGPCLWRVVVLPLGFNGGSGGARASFTHTPEFPWIRGRSQKLNFQQLGNVCGVRPAMVSLRLPRSAVVTLRSQRSAAAHHRVAAWPYPDLATLGQAEILSASN